MPSQNWTREQARAYFANLLNGQSNGGTVGFNLENAVAARQAGGQADPGLNQFGTWVTDGSEGGSARFVPNAGSGVDNRGFILGPNGEQNAQLTYDSVGGPSGVKDPSLVRNDPKFGLLTGANNINAPASDWANDNMFTIVAAVLGGMMAPAIMAGGAEGGLASTAGIAATDAAESGGTLALNAAGTGTVPYVGTGVAGGAAVANPYAPIDYTNPVGNPSYTLDPTPGGPLASLPPGTQSPAPVTDLSTATAPPGGNGLLSNAGNWIQNNPLRALSLANTARSLLGSHSSSASNSGSSSGSKSAGGTGLGGSPVQRPDMQQNPYLLAQLKAGGYL